MWLRLKFVSVLFIVQISASLNLEEELKMPKLIAETTWNLDL